MRTIIDIHLLLPGFSIGQTSGQNDNKIFIGTMPHSFSTGASGFYGLDIDSHWE